MRKLTNWYFNNISATTSVALIAFFFTSALNLFTLANQYSVDELEILYEQEGKKLDSIAAYEQEKNYKLTKMVTYDNLFKKIDSVNLIRFSLIAKSISYYQNNHIPNDSLKYIKFEFAKMNSLMPYEIGSLEAYLDIDIGRRTPELKVFLRYLHAQYEFTKDLDKYLSRKIKKNNLTTQKVEDLKISMASYVQFRVDKLHVERFDKNNHKDEFKKFENKIDKFQKNYNIYLTLSFVCCLFFTLILFLAFSCGHFRN
ncbi:MAG: hypothetical protein ACOVOQ_06340 [Flavobacterium sp.]